MAINARFQADFEQFFSAVDKADAKLREFESGAGKVERSLNKMVDSFSGRKIIQDATLMTQAIQRIGGVANLTTQELERAGSTASQAADKMKRLGVEVPPEIQKIADAYDRMNKAGGENITTAVAIGSAIGTSIGEIAAKAVLALGGAILSVAKALPEIALKGAAVADVEENFKHLTTQAGQLGDVLLGTLKAGTHNTITDFELMKTVNANLAAGVRLTQKEYDTLAKGAFALAQATGGDVKTAFDAMNEAMLTGRTRSLAALTGKIDLIGAEEKYARSLGTTVAHLTEEDKLEVGRLAILDAVGKATKRLGDQTDGLDERVAQLQTAWANFQENLGKTIASSPVLITALDNIAQAFKDIFGNAQSTVITTIAKAVDDVAISLVSMAKAGVEAGGFLIKEFYAAKVVFGDLAQLLDATTKLWLLYRQATTIGILPGQIDLTQYQALGKEIQELTKRQQERGKSLQEDKKAQADVDAQTASLVARLEEMRRKMEAAGKAGQDFVGPLQGVTKASEEAADKQGRLSGTLKVTEADLAKAAAAAKKAADATAESLKRQQALVDDYNAAVAKASADELTERLATEQKWYDNKVAIIEKAKRDNQGFADTLKQLDAEQAQLDVTYGARKIAIREDVARKLDDLAQKESQRIAKLQDDALAVEREFSLKGLDLTLARIDRQQLAEVNAARLTAIEKKTSEENLQLELAAIARKYDAQRRAERAKAEQQSRDEIIALREQALSIEEQMTLTSIEAQIRANERALTAALHRLDVEGKADEDHVRETIHLYETKAQAIINTNDPVWKAWHHLQSDMRQDWADTFEKALEVRKNFEVDWYAFTNSLLAPFRKMMGALLSEWQSNILGLGNATKKAADDLSKKAVQAATPATGTSGGPASALALDIKNPSIAGYEIDWDQIGQTATNVANTLQDTAKSWFEAIRQQFERFRDALTGAEDNFRAAMGDRGYLSAFGPQATPFTGLPGALSQVPGFPGEAPAAGGGGGGIDWARVRGIASAPFGWLGKAFGGGGGDITEAQFQKAMRDRGYGMFAGGPQPSAFAGGLGGGMESVPGWSPSWQQPQQRRQLQMLSRVGEQTVDVSGYAAPEPPGEFVGPIQPKGAGVLDKYGGLAGIGKNLIGGILTGGISTAISFGIGKLTEGIVKLFSGPSTEDRVKDQARFLGLAFSDTLSQQIVKDSDRLHDVVAGTLANLSSVIAENGGLTAKSVDKWIPKLHDVFSVIQQGHLSAADAAKILDQNFQGFADAATDSTGRLSDKMREIIGLDEQFGTHSKAIADYLKQQGTNAITGFNAVVAGTKNAVVGYDAIKKAVDDAAASVRTLAQGNFGTSGKVGQAGLAVLAGTTNPLEIGGLGIKAAAGAGGDQSAALSASEKLNIALADQARAAAGAKRQLSDLGIQAVASFSAAVASGTSVSQALSDIGPSLDTLVQSYNDLGISTDDAALKNLMLQRQVQVAAPELVAAIGGINLEMASLSNMGLLNVDTFGAMERTGFDMFTRLQGEVSHFGGTQRDALLPMQDFLHQAERAAKDLGIPLDANTQMMIDQSKELKIWKDLGTTPIDKLTEGMQTLVDKVSKLIDELRGIPPTVKSDVTVTTHHVDDSPSSDEDPMRQHSGGIIQKFHGGAAKILPFPFPAIVAHSGLAADEVPAILQTGESVLNRRATKMLGADTIRALNKSSGGDSGRGQVVDLAALRDEMKRNTDAVNGLRSDLRKAPELTALQVSAAIAKLQRRR